MKHLSGWLFFFRERQLPTHPQQTSGVSTISTISTNDTRYLLINDLFVAAFFYLNILQGIETNPLSAWSFNVLPSKFL